jgi:hypothetical protein
MTFLKTNKNLNPIDLDFSNLYPFINGDLFGQRYVKEFGKPKPNFTYSMLCSDCKHSNGTKCSPEQNPQVSYPDDSISYKLNNHTYRSDDFNKKNTSDNFLFTGCSLTFGTGLPYTHTWAHALNKELNGEKFLNLGVAGGSCKILIFDIYRYIEKFGKPKAIFALMPDLNRFDSWATVPEKMFPNEEKSYLTKNYIMSENLIDNAKNLTQLNKEQVNIILWDFYHSMTNLENFLETLNIDFLWSTWHDDSGKYFNQLNFKNYFHNMFTDFDLIDHLECPPEYDKRFWLSARDIHPGLRTQLFYKSIFKNEYKKYMDKKSSVQKSAE